MRELPHDPNCPPCGLGTAQTAHARSRIALSMDSGRRDVDELDRDSALSPHPVWMISEEADSHESPLPLSRLCPRCREHKPTSEFHNSRARQLSYCAPCRREYDRWYYHLRGWATRSGRKRARRAAGREWLDSLKAGIPCTDCGEVFPEFVMHWDHLPGLDKVAAVSRLAREKPRELALAEITKCELVCANCHAIRTSERRRRKSTN